MTGASETDDLVASALRLLRLHLGLRVAFVSQLTDDERIFRFVDTDGHAGTPKVGGADPIEQSYCHYVASGQLPPFLLDPATEPIVARLAAEHGMPVVGTHLSVPLVLSDGTVYGTVCCFDPEVHETLRERDLETVLAVATMITHLVEDAESRRLQRERQRTRLRTVTVGRDLELELVFQPIVHLGSGGVVGFEALSRFPELANGVSDVFEDAWYLGAGSDLELRAVAAALLELPNLPRTAYLSVNVAASTLVSPRFLDLVRSVDPHRLVVEVTEHDAVEDYGRLVAAATDLTADGIRLAIDDVGTGFSGLDHVLRLDPHILKVDGGLVTGVDASPAKQAMVSALLTFATRVQAEVVAEHVETEAECEALRRLGVIYAQGYHFGRPGALPAIIDVSDRAVAPRA
jgi:EAL domain-containing protein (putative c-di-GMP-specific phosphodiesterase class I)